MAICMPIMNLGSERLLRLIIIARIWGVLPHRLNTLNIFTSDFWISCFKLLTLILIRFVLMIQEIISFFFLGTSGTKLLLSFVIEREISINLFLFVRMLKQSALRPMLSKMDTVTIGCFSEDLRLSRCYLYLKSLSIRCWHIYSRITTLYLLRIALNYARSRLYLIFLVF